MSFFKRINKMVWIRQFGGGRRNLYDMFYSCTPYAYIKLHKQIRNNFNKFMATTIYMTNICMTTIHQQCRHRGVSRRQPRRLTAYIQAVAKKKYSRRRKILTAAHLYQYIREIAIFFIWFIILESKEVIDSINETTY